MSLVFPTLKKNKTCLTEHELGGKGINGTRKVLKPENLPGESRRQGESLTGRY